MLCSPKIFQKRNFEEILTFLKKTWRIWRNRTYQKMGTFFTKISKIEIRKRTKHKIITNQLKMTTKLIETFLKKQCFSTKNDQSHFFSFFCEVVKKQGVQSKIPLTRNSEKLSFLSENLEKVIFWKILGELQRFNFEEKSLFLSEKYEKKILWKIVVKFGCCNFGKITVFE